MKDISQMHKILKSDIYYVIIKFQLVFGNV